MAYVYPLSANYYYLQTRLTNRCLLYFTLLYSAPSKTVM